ncbi:MAG TPA: hypothetical protein ENJ29_12710 [Bacteroidetes bacterium]|nr:hypothetical protein [Bacteroidota bacterium]
MLYSLHRFLDQIIDYAGIFPPARLRIEEAIGNYASYRSGEDAWMLGRFICPAIRLPELTLYHSELFHQNPPFAFAVLGSGGRTIEEFLAKLRLDMDFVSKFQHNNGRSVLVDVLEMALPEEVIAECDDGVIFDLIKVVHGYSKFAGPLRYTPFFEGYQARNAEASIDSVVQGIKRFREHVQETDELPALLPGYKLRCGGSSPGAIPSVATLAHALLACRKAGIPIKFNAGLDQPVRSFDETQGTHVHGFFNVFGAAILLWTHDLEKEQLEEILADENPAHFRFDEDHFSWNSLSADCDEIYAAREALAISFGSCRFDEPVRALRALGYLA